MNNPNSRIPLMLALLVTGLILGGVACGVRSIFAASEFAIPVLGWQVPPSLAFFLAATVIMAIAKAWGIDLGESRSSLEIDGDDGWDD
jgi:hypothetical protein